MQAFSTKVVVALCLLVASALCSASMGVLFGEQETRSSNSAKTPYVHKCLHDEILKTYPDSKPSKANTRFQKYKYSQEDLKRMSKSTTQQQQNVYQPLRVKFIYDSAAQAALPAARFQKVQEAFDSLQIVIANMLSVVHTTSNLTASGSACST